MQTGKRDYRRRITTAFYMQVGNPMFLCNMDQTPVYMNFDPNLTVHHMGDRTASIRTGRILFEYDYSNRNGCNGCRCPVYSKARQKVISRAVSMQFLQVELYAQCKKKHEWMQKL